ncbi:hypothetical protein GUITHDRAFT_161344, partial [Guillardia theta CCMP2712]
MTMKATCLFAALLLLIFNASSAFGFALKTSNLLLLLRPSSRISSQSQHRIRGGSSQPSPPNMLFGNFFGDKNNEAGKFVRQSNLQGVNGVFGPPGLIVGGLGEDELEVLSEVVESALRVDATTAPQLPIAVLGKEDFDGKTLLKDVVSTLSERDSVLPDEPAQLKFPMIMISGLNPIQVSACVKAIVASGIKGGIPGGTFHTPMCALVVPKAMDKSMVQLLDEVEGDHLANR